MPNVIHDAQADGRIAQLISQREHFLMFLRARGYRSSAEDILHAAYMRLLERGVSVRDEHKLTSWFYSVLHNAAVDHVRTCQRRGRLNMVAACENALASRTDETDAELAPVLASFDALEPTYRDVLQSAYVEGLSISAIALRLGLSRNAATVRLHRARRALAAVVHRSAAADSVVDVDRPRRACQLGA